MKLKNVTKTKYEVKNVIETADKGFTADFYASGVKVCSVAHEPKHYDEIQIPQIYFMDTFHQIKRYIATLPVSTFEPFIKKLVKEKIILQTFQKREKRFGFSIFVVNKVHNTKCKEWTYKKPFKDMKKKDLQKTINTIKETLNPDEQIINTNLEKLGITV